MVSQLFAVQRQLSITNYQKKSSRLIMCLQILLRITAIFPKMPVPKVFTTFSFNLLILNVVILAVVVTSFSGSTHDDNPYRHTRVLDRQGKYVLEWLADWERNRVFFNVSVQTLGYIGFGLSKKGLMDGADIIIGGIYPNGKPYFTDRHGIGHQVPEIDNSQDWRLHSAWESTTHTFLSFSRLFETCDDDDRDLSINDDSISLIWAFGERDNDRVYHFQNRGHLPVYLLDPDVTPRELLVQNYRNVTDPKPVQQLGDLKVWKIPMKIMLPTQDTTYLCTFHKAPSYKSKQHIVGFRSVFKSDIERRHIHHFILNICYPPRGVNAKEMFGRFVGRPGEECYQMNTDAYPIPTQYCLESRHEYAVGAEPVFFPDHIGIPLSEAPEEYYVWQIHYDNPHQVSNVMLDFSLEVYYTGNLRQHDAGFMFIGHLPRAPSIMIPPSATEHKIYSTCAAQCTMKMFPEAGINVVATRLHTHLAGRGVRILHIQNQKELPLTIDDNYNFNFQPFRILREERKVNPGDILTGRCIYDTTDRNGSVTVGGYSTRNEMCNFFILYYPYIRSDTYAACSSDLRADVYRNLLGIYDSTWSDDRREYIVSSPQSNAGLTVSQVADRIDWTINKRVQIQLHQGFIPQVSWCPSVNPNSILREVSAPVTFQRPALDTSRGFSDLNIEINDPASEFIGLLPRHLVPYQKESRCIK